MAGLSSSPCSFLCSWTSRQQVAALIAQWSHPKGKREEGLRKGKRKGENVFSPQYFTKQKHCALCSNPRKSARINLTSSTFMHSSGERWHEPTWGGWETFLRSQTFLTIKEIEKLLSCYNHRFKQWWPCFSREKVHQLYLPWLLRLPLQKAEELRGIHTVLESMKR